MKSTAIFKIIVWSLVTVFLIGFFISIAVTDGLPGSLPFSLNLPWIGGDVEVVREQEFSADEIDSLDLRWVSASAYILPTDGDKIIVTEKASGNIAEEELLQISERDGTLFMEQGTQLRRIFFFNMGRRVVNEIRLPVKQYNKIRTSLTSGRIQINDLDIETLEVEMKSGQLIFESVNSQNIDIDITSGKADIQGSFDEISTKLTSGSVSIETDTAPSSLLVNITSGKATVTIPDNDGFILAKNITSGSIQSDFALDDFNRYGNAERQYSIRITSGKAELLKK